MNNLTKSNSVNNAVSNPPVAQPVKSQLVDKKITGKIDQSDTPSLMRSISLKTITNVNKENNIPKTFAMKGKLNPNDPQKAKIITQRKFE